MAPAEVDPIVVRMLATDLLRDIFRTVAKNRLVIFKDLVTASHRDPDTVRQSVDGLKAAQLVKEEAAPVSDFNRLYVTAAGLRAERQLERLSEVVEQPSAIR